MAEMLKKVLYVYRSPDGRLVRAVETDREFRVREAMDRLAGEGLRPPARLRHRAQARVQLGERGRSGGGVHTVREGRAEMRKCAYLAVAALGAVAFLAAHDWATAWRGCEAVGGEFLLLLLPLWVWVVEMLVTDWREGR